jgi:hypothetical protein
MIAQVVGGAQGQMSQWACGKLWGEVSFRVGRFVARGAGKQLGCRLAGAHPSKTAKGAAASVVVVSAGKNQG